MEDLNDFLTGNTLTAAQFNQPMSEIQNIIEDTGQALSSGDLDQLGKGLAEYVANGTFYTDSGAANSYTLSTINSKIGPHRYVDGIQFAFLPGNTNTGASTININGLGSKDLNDLSGNALPAGAIVADELCRGYYDLANDECRVLPSLTPTTYNTLLSGRKNAIINGNFDIWQRNTTQTSSGYGSDDRWLNSQAGSTKTHSQQSFTLGQTDVPNSPDFFSRTVVSSVAGAANQVSKYQIIKGVESFSGETVTLSFWAKADSAKNIATELFQTYGSGGSPTGINFGIGVTTHNLTTSWQKFTATVAIPSVSGGTIGTAGNDGLGLNFWFDAGSDFDARTNSLGQQSGTFDIAQVQLEKGPIASDFERRTFEEELDLCLPYYEKSYNYNNYPGAAVGDGAMRSSSFQGGVTTGVIDATFSFQKRKILTPTVTIYDASGNLNVCDRIEVGVLIIPNQPIAVGPVSQTKFGMISTSGGAAGVLAVHYTADAEL